MARLMDCRCALATVVVRNSSTVYNMCNVSIYCFSFPDGMSSFHLRFVAHLFTWLQYISSMYCQIELLLNQNDCDDGLGMTFRRKSYPFEFTSIDMHSAVDFLVGLNLLML